MVKAEGQTLGLEVQDLELGFNRQFT